MKHFKFITLLILLINFSVIQAQDCLSIQDTVYQCGFELELDTVFQDISWEVQCEADTWVAIEPQESSIVFQFSDCGYYTIIFDHPECVADTFVVAVEDESYTNYWSSSDNDFGYSGVNCPSGGSDCSNSVSISGGSLINPSWSICQTLQCSSTEIQSVVYITDSTNCIIDSIQYIVDVESGSSSDCWDGDQSAFIDIDPNTGEIDNSFFEFLDSLNGELISQGLCPFVQDDCISIPCEVDSVSYDTSYLEFPVHLGGQWTLIENQDTILLDSLTPFSKDGKNLVLEILPHPKYFGPDNITFNLFEVDIQGDTFPTTENINLIVYWQEQFVLDSIEKYDVNYHYADSTCIGCGNNSSSFSYGNIPGIPEFPCGPISIGFGDPCACSTGDLFVQGQDFINCNFPCADIMVDLNGINPSIIEWTDDFGNFIGSTDAIITCTGGFYNCYVISIDGCEYQSGFFVEEDFETIEPALEDNYLLDCETGCVTLSTGLEGDPNAEAVFTNPDGTTILSHSAVICVPGIVTVEVENLLNGCVSFKTISIGTGDPCECSTGDLFVDGEALINCNFPCADLLAVAEGIDAEQYEWIDDSGNIIGSSSSFTTCVGGFYSCVVTTIDGCIYEAGFSVQEDFETIEPDLEDNYFLDCETNCVTISTNLEGDPNASAVFTLPDGSIILSHSAMICVTGIVTVEVENLLNGCIWLITVSVEEKPAPSLTIPSSFTIHCSPEIILKLEGDQSDISTYEWTGPGINGSNFQDENPSVNSQGQYSVIITNNSGCKQTLNTEVDQVDILVFTHDSSPACFESNTGSVDIEILGGGIGPFMYNIDDRDWQEESEILELEAGSHTIRILNVDGCVAQQVIVVDEIESISIDDGLFVSEYDLCTESNVNIDLSTFVFSGVTALWDDGTTEFIKLIDEEGIYSFTLTSECEEVSIDIEINDSRLDEDRLIYIPTAFSPNEDGVNDEFMLSTPHQIESFEIAIYDRWGSKVFESIDLSDSWNGKVLNQGGLNASYSYLMSVEVESCSEQNILVSKVGSITILK